MGCCKGYITISGPKGTALAHIAELVWEVFGKCKIYGAFKTDYKHGDVFEVDVGITPEDEEHNLDKDEISKAIEEKLSGAEQTWKVSVNLSESKQEVQA